MTWTQPLCGWCWIKENGDRVATHIAEEYAEEEVCCMCGRPTSAGIYIRRNPKDVPYPRDREES